MSRTEYEGWPKYSKKEWNLEIKEVQVYYIVSVLYTIIRAHQLMGNIQMKLASFDLTCWSIKCITVGFCYLLIMRLCTTFRMMILSVQSFRNSVILLFKLGLASCLATTLRLSQDALHFLSNWIRFSDNCSKSTCGKRKEVVINYEGKQCYLHSYLQMEKQNKKETIEKNCYYKSQEKSNEMKIPAQMNNVEHCYV